MVKQARDWGEEIFPYIPKNGEPGWIALPDLARRAKLTPNQVRVGIRQLREANDGEPLVSGPEGYRFTHEPAQVDAFRIRMCRTALSYVRTVWEGAVHPFIERFAPDAKQAHRMALRFELALGDLEELLDHAA